VPVDFRQTAIPFVQAPMLDHVMDMFHASNFQRGKYTPKVLWSNLPYGMHSHRYFSSKKWKSYTRDDFVLQLYTVYGLSGYQNVRNVVNYDRSRWVW
jgi:hypothetical protein